MLSVSRKIFYRCIFGVWSFFWCRYLRHPRLPIVLHQNSLFSSREKCLFPCTGQALCLSNRRHLQWPSLDPSVHIIIPLRYFLASSSACFWYSITCYPLNLMLGPIVLTGSTPFAESIKCSMVVCRISQCPYKVGLTSSVHIRVFSGSSLGWKPPSHFLKLMGKISLAGCWSERLSSRWVYNLWQ